MPTHERAGQLPLASDLVDLSKLISDYYTLRPDPETAEQRVQFGTSGHRGAAGASSFNEAHVAAIVQATCDLRAKAGIRGGMFVAKDTHALSEPAWRTALEVLVGNGVPVWTAPADTYVATPLLSRAIVARRSDEPVDGLVITPSHNPPPEGGIKYNATHGGPAEGSITRAIQDRANELLGQAVKRVPFERAKASVRWHDFHAPYIRDLQQVVDLERVAAAGIRLGAHPLGGATVGLWGSIAETYRLNLEMVDDAVDGTFRFIPLDGDGKIRMDCSSPHAMAGLVERAGDFDLCFGNDADGDRHGIVERSGLMNPNHVLALAVDVLFRTRESWSSDVGVAMTVVTSDLVRRVAASHGRTTFETPVGFKWFVPFLQAQKAGLAGEESAGASILDLAGKVWTTDKDGVVMDLLAAEMLARAGRSLTELFDELTSKLGRPHYRRVDAPATPEQKAVLSKLSADAVKVESLAGDPIERRMVQASGNGEAIGGLKVTTEAGWFAARPSGTENIFKIYAESFRDPDHLEVLLKEAQALVEKTFQEAGV